MTTPLDTPQPTPVVAPAEPVMQWPAVSPTVVTPVMATGVSVAPATGAQLTTAIVPAAVRIAAGRAFIRTLTRGYAGAIPAGGVTAAALLSLSHPDWTIIAASAGAWLLAPAISAFASWLSILSNGVPSDYTNVVTVAPLATGE